MKIAAINEITKLDNEKALKEILTHLEKLVKEEIQGRSGKIENIFEEAVAQYGDTLKKLAE